MNDNKNAKLIFNSKEVELDVLHGSVGPSVIDIRKLYGEIGCFTYDLAMVQLVRVNLL